MELKERAQGIAEELKREVDLLYNPLLAEENEE